MFPPMIRGPLGAPAMPLSTANSPTVSMNGHMARMPIMEEEREPQPTLRKSTAKRGANAKSNQRPSPPDAPFDNLGDVIIPSSEKEGGYLRRFE